MCVCVIGKPQFHGLYISEQNFKICGEIVSKQFLYSLIHLHDHIC